MNTFIEFPKLARLSRDCIISEKIDGTNTQLFVWDENHLVEGVPIGPRPEPIPYIWSNNGISLAVGSRTQWITVAKDNYSFAIWCCNHAEELINLRHGRHFGEWWGSGIQRGYNLPKGEKRFSLFNVQRWCLYNKTPERILTDDPRIEKYQENLPACCSLVPVIYKGIFETRFCEGALEWLRTNGSLASPGFMKPEGIVCFHIAANMGFKKTLEKDEVPKSLQ